MANTSSDASAGDESVQYSKTLWCHVSRQHKDDTAPTISVYYGASVRLIVPTRGSGPVLPIFFYERRCHQTYCDV